MKREDKYFLFESCLVVALLYMAVSLFGSTLPIYNLIVPAGILVGLSFSWVFRDNTKANKLLVDICALGVFIWMTYSVLRSSLFYKEVIIILVKGVFILEIVLSLNAYSASGLTYMEALSVPLVMSSSLFSNMAGDTYTLLSIGYLACWFALLRIKFYLLVKPENETNMGRFVSIFLLVAILVLSLAASGLLAAKVPLSNFRKGGLLTEQSSGIEAGLGEMEKEYYGAQDEFQKEVTSLMLDMRNKDDRYQVLSAINTLIKDSASTIEVEKANEGLVSRLGKPGPGIEKGEGENAVHLIKDYNDKKTALNMKKAKDGFVSVMRNNRFPLKERLRMLRQINKIRYGTSSRQMRKENDWLRDKIDSSTIPAAAKKEMKEYASRLKEWRNFDLYNRQAQGLKERLEKMDKAAEKELGDLFKEIQQSGNLSELKKANMDLEQLEKKLGKTYPAEIEQAKQMLAEKMEMLLAYQAMALRSEAEKSARNTESQNSLEEATDNIKDADTAEKFSYNSSALQEESRWSGQAFANKMAAFTETKAYSLANELAGEIKKEFDNSILSARQKGNFLKGINRLENEKDASRIEQGIDKLKQDVDEFYRRGLIYASARETLHKKLEDLKVMLLSKTGSAKQVQQQKEDTAALKQEPRVTDLAQPVKRLIAIKVSPQNMVVSLGESGQFRCQGTYNDNSVQDLTTDARWLSKNRPVAVVTGGKVSALSIGETEISAQYQGIVSKPAAILQVGEPKLLSVIISPADIRMSPGYQLRMKAEGYYGDSSLRDVTELAEWTVTGGRAVKLEKNLVRPVFFGSAQVAAKYNDIVSLPANIDIIVTVGWLAWVFMKISMLSALVFMLALLVMFVFTKHEKRMLFLLRSDPKKFIIGLNDNLNKILRIFGPKNEHCLTPLVYAELVENNYAIKDATLKRFVQKFEEAKYSSHILQQEDAQSALGFYRGFLNTMLARQGKIKLFFRYCISLFRRAPL